MAKPVAKPRRPASATVKKLTATFTAAVQSPPPPPVALALEDAPEGPNAREIMRLDQLRQRLDRTEHLATGQPLPLLDSKCDRQGWNGVCLAKIQYATCHGICHLRDDAKSVARARKSLISEMSSELERRLAIEVANEADAAASVRPVSSSSSTVAPWVAKFVEARRVSSDAASRTTSAAPPAKKQKGRTPQQVAALTASGIDAKRATVARCASVAVAPWTVAPQVSASKSRSMGPPARPTVVPPKPRPTSGLGKGSRAPSAPPLKAVPKFMPPKPKGKGATSSVVRHSSRSTSAGSSSIGSPWRAGPAPPARKR